MRRALSFALLGCVACSGTAAVEPCDIRVASCQHDIFLAVQSVRDASWDPWLDMPPMRVISKDQYMQELEQRRLLEQSQTDPNDYDYYTPAFKAFRLLDPNEPPNSGSTFMAEFFAAYYDEVTRGITIIDRGDNTDRLTDSQTLAHELVHAAQERDIGFAQIDAWVDSTDANNARGALVEGEAVLYENLVGLAMTGRVPDAARFADTNRAWLESTRGDIAKDVSPLRIATSSLRYPLGSAYMSEAWFAGGPLAVRRAFAAHPTTAVAFMGGRDISTSVRGCDGPRAPASFKLRASTSLGAEGLYAFATRALDEASAWSTALSWGWDSFSVYADADKHLAVVWQVHFADSAGAQSFVDSVSDQLPDGVTLRRTSRADTLALFASSGAIGVGDWAWQDCDLTP